MFTLYVTFRHGRAIAQEAAQIKSYFLFTLLIQIQTRRLWEWTVVSPRERSLDWRPNSSRNIMQKVWIWSEENFAPDRCNKLDWFIIHIGQNVVMFAWINNKNVLPPTTWKEKAIVLRNSVKIMKGKRKLENEN